MEFEREVEATLNREAKRRGGLTIKVGYGGLPDRLVLLPGSRVFFAEVKRKDGKTSKLQEVWVARIERLGVRVYVPKTKEEVKALFEEGGDALSYSRRTSTSESR